MTEKTSVGLLTPPDSLDHYAELLHIRQKGARRDIVIAFVIGLLCVLALVVFSPSPVTESIRWGPGVVLVIAIVAVVSRSIEYAARDEVLELLEVLRRVERDAHEES